MIGRRLAHYDIVEKLGQGGMGEVYRAHDSKLGRDVALKILRGEGAKDPERRARFEREARTVAALKHPNIVTIYSVEETDGIPFLTMELVEGRLLSEAIAADGLRLDRFFDYAIPLADAVGWAHERGITHRDLKPANIMIDRDGRIKVLDFGLAKLFAVSSDLESAQTIARTHDTAAGHILGTPAYMSPEQAESKPLDHRSDIFSLGIVLYEMATGRRPFEGDTPISTISSILKDQPRSISDLKPANPRELGRIVSHCLEKDPERRFQTAKDVRNELEGLRREIDSGDVMISTTSAAAALARESGPPPFSANAMAIVGVVLGLAVVAGWMFMRSRGESGGNHVSVTDSGTPETKERQMAVVLPFENLGPPEDAYFAAGVTDEITSRLTTVSGLGVISRTSAENYTQSGKTMRQIGSDLGVDYVLEGSVRWAKTSDGKGRVRITPQLVRVADDTPVWSETYDREVSDIFDVQTDIATHVVDALGVTLQASERESIGERPTSNLEAYELYTKAKSTQCGVFTECDAEIVALLEKALALDPKFIAAWYMLSREHSFMYHLNVDRTESRLARAKAALDQAEAIDPTHPFTRLARGFYYYYGFRDYDRALTEFVAATEARPNDAEARFSVSLIYRRKGEYEESVRQMKQAIELDPKNAQYVWDLADSYDAMRLPDLSMENYERSLAIKNEPAVIGDMVLTSLRFHGDTTVARRLLERASDPNSLALGAAKWRIWMFERNYAAAASFARQAEISSPSLQASVASGLGFVATLQDGLEAARPALEDAVNRLKAVLNDSPGNYVNRMDLALTYAYLGRANDAVGEAKLAVDMVAKDAFTAPLPLETLALVYARTGRPDESIELIERLLTLRYDDPLTIAVLRKDPVWDPLRDNPKFKAILKRSS